MWGSGKGGKETAPGAYIFWRFQSPVGSGSGSILRGFGRKNVSPVLSVSLPVLPWQQNQITKASNTRRTSPPTAMPAMAPTGRRSLVLADEVPEFEPAGVTMGPLLELVEVAQKLLEVVVEYG